jgi:hypothetical protein
LSFLISVVGGGVLGGAAGAFDAVVGLGVDPVELGPKIAQYAPWIVPPQFHGQPMTKHRRKTPARLRLRRHQKKCR